MGSKGSGPWRDAGIMRRAGAMVEGRPHRPLAPACDGEAGTICGYQRGMSAAHRPALSALARRRRGRQAVARGTAGEARAIAMLEDEGWTIRGRRVRTAAGEIDVIAEKAGLIAFLEVKTRPRLAEAAAALSAKQRARLLKAAEIVLAGHPGWGREGVRFDVIVVDRHGAVRRISDAFREE